MAWESVSDLFLANSTDPLTVLFFSHKTISSDGYQHFLCDLSASWIVQWLESLTWPIEQQTLFFYLMGDPLSSLRKCHCAEWNLSNTEWI